MYSQRSEGGEECRKSGGTSNFSPVTKQPVAWRCRWSRAQIPLLCQPRPLPAHRGDPQHFESPCPCSIPVGTCSLLLSVLHPTCPEPVPVYFLVLPLGALWMWLLAMLMQFSGKKNVTHAYNSHSKSSSST